MSPEVLNSLERIPPQSLEAEQAVLGAILVDPEALFKIAEFLEAKDFYRFAHEMIYKAALALFGDNEPVDIVSVSEYLKDHELLDDVGGRAYINDLSLAIATSENVVHYAHIVREKSRLRLLIQAGTEIVFTANDEIESEVAFDKAEQIIFQLSQKGISDDLRHIQDFLPAAYERVEDRFNNKDKLLGIPSGFYDLDVITAGFQKSNMIVIAARPSMGKTAFALNIATHVALGENTPVAFFSLEMSTDELVQRMLCSEAEVDGQRVRSGEIHQQDFVKLTQAMAVLGDAPLYIDDSDGLTLMQIRAKARKLKTEVKDLGLIIVDYLQLIDGRENLSRGDNRVQEISMISKGLKSIAKELKVPVIALSQLSRNLESRPDKRPMLSDLRESGAIEQDSDVVIFLYRDEYYTKDDTEKPGIATVIVAKQRNGPTSELDLLFRNNITKFLNPARRHTAIF
jgi:replicative DNA helicase